MGGPLVGRKGWRSPRVARSLACGGACVKRAQDFQGYMKGGAREGQRAALEVVHAL